MKRNAPLDGVVWDSACASLIEKTRAARKSWADLNSSFDQCVFETSGEGAYEVDPFAVMHIVAEARTKDFLVAHLGEACLSEMERWARARADAALLSFDSELRELCARDGVALMGRFPAYRIDGFLQVRLSPDKGDCGIGSKKVKSLYAKRIWIEIASAIRDESLRQADPQDLLLSFHDAYQRAISRLSESKGASIPIKVLFSELATTPPQQEKSGNQKNPRSRRYTEEYFRRDLSRLMAAGDFVARGGAKMELLPTAFAKEGVPVNIGDGVRIIGRVAFSEPQR